MAIIIFLILIVIFAVITLTIDPEVKQCVYCKGPVTLRELFNHPKKCPRCPKKEDKGL